MEEFWKILNNPAAGELLKIGVQVVMSVFELIKQGVSASKEKHDAIIARLQKTNEELNDAIAKGREVSESAAKEAQDAIDKARGA